MKRVSAKPRGLQRLKNIIFAYTPRRRGKRGVLPGAFLSLHGRAVLGFLRGSSSTTIEQIAHQTSRAESTVRKVLSRHQGIANETLSAFWRLVSPDHVSSIQGKGRERELSSTDKEWIRQQGHILAAEHEVYFHELMAGPLCETKVHVEVDELRVCARVANIQDLVRRYSDRLPRGKGAERHCALVFEEGFVRVVFRRAPMERMDVARRDIPCHHVFDIHHTDGALLAKLGLERRGGACSTHRSVMDPSTKQWVANPGRWTCSACTMLKDSLPNIHLVIHGAACARGLHWALLQALFTPWAVEGTVQVLKYDLAVDLGRSITDLFVVPARATSERRYQAATFYVGTGEEDGDRGVRFQPNRGMVTGMRLGGADPLSVYDKTDRLAYGIGVRPVHMAPGTSWTRLEAKIRPKDRSVAGIFSRTAYAPFRRVHVGDRRELLPGGVRDLLLDELSLAGVIGHDPITDATVDPERPKDVRTASFWKHVGEQVRRQLPTRSHAEAKADAVRVVEVLEETAAAAAQKLDQAIIAALDRRIPELQDVLERALNRSSRTQLFEMPQARS